MMTFGSLFSGFGMMDLGFHRAGMLCQWQCEINPHRRAILKKRFPGVHRCFECEQGRAIARDTWAMPEPGTLRMDDGIAHRVDRHRKQRIEGVGDGVPPLMGELIAREILKAT